MSKELYIVGYDPCSLKSNLTEEGSALILKKSEMSESLLKQLTDNSEVISMLETTKKIICLLNGYSDLQIKNILYDVKDLMPYKNKLLGLD